MSHNCLCQYNYKHDYNIIMPSHVAVHDRYWWNLLARHRQYILCMENILFMSTWMMALRIHCTEYRTIWIRRGRLRWSIKSICFSNTGAMWLRMKKHGKTFVVCWKTAKTMKVLSLNVTQHEKTGVMCAKYTCLYFYWISPFLNVLLKICKFYKILYA